MKIKSAEIIISAVSPKQYPQDNLQEFALVGRSNVGKSSTINTLLNRKSLARVSQSPGKTRTINFYLINKEFYLVDLPGYGYAKVSKDDRAAWGKIIETYLTSRPNLKEVILLVDVRHEPTADDVLMYDWIKHFGFGRIVIATKLDKINRSQYQKHFKMIREKLKMAPEDQLLPISSLKKLGMEAIWDKMDDVMQQERVTGVNASTKEESTINEGK